MSGSIQSQVPPPFMKRTWQKHKLTHFKRTSEKVFPGASDDLKLISYSLSYFYILSHRQNRGCQLSGKTLWGPRVQWCCYSQGLLLVLSRLSSIIPLQSKEIPRPRDVNSYFKLQALTLPVVTHCPQTHLPWQVGKPTHVSSYARVFHAITQRQQHWRQTCLEVREGGRPVQTAPRFSFGKTCISMKNAHSQKMTTDFTRPQISAQASVMLGWSRRAENG